jgi:hypothetical protein
MQTSFDEIIKKLDAFIRKFYLNKMLKGLIYFLSLAIMISLLVLSLEYFGKFNSQTRTFLFYGSIATLLFILIRLIVLPFLAYLKIGKSLSHEQAADVVGKHFGEVSDKLKNLLQLQKKISQSESDLLLASIDQKVSQLRPIPFSLAVDFSQNQRYLKYLGVPLVIFMMVYFIEPTLISESTSRLIAHNQEIIPQAPYELDINNQELKAFKNEDFKLMVSAKGKEIPSQLIVVIEGEDYLMRQSAFGAFQHTFKNVQSSFSFHLTDGEFRSPSYEVEVITPPSLIEFNIEADYPKYLKRKPEIFSNSGDITVPEGSRLRWIVNTEATSNVDLITTDSTYSFTPSDENEYSYSDYFRRSINYGLRLYNASIDLADTVNYAIDVIPDLRPQIKLQAIDDSSGLQSLYFEGNIKDDHGFSALYFHYKIVAERPLNSDYQRVDIPVNQNVSQSKFYYNWEIARLDLQAGEAVEYYFEVWDNDGVNGRKSAQTAKLRMSTPTRDEIKKKNRESNEEIKEELEKNIKLSQEINKELADLKEKIFNKKEIGYQEKKQLEKLLEKQKQLKSSVENLQKQQKANNRLEKQFGEQNEELVEKQRQLEELFEKVMSEEMKKTMEELEKLMEQFEKDKLQNALEKMELDNEQLEQELDRNLELFKQLELEKELAEAIEKLEELKEKQEELKEKTADKKSDKEELEKEQGKLKKEFEELDKDLDDLEKKNQELENPNQMEKTQSLEDEIKEDMKKSLEELSKNNRSKSQENQQKSQEDMQKLSDKLQSSQMQMQSAQAAENLEDLRALLENLITLSFDQEALMEELRQIERDDPRYVELGQEQRKLQDDSQVIKDSLFALSKRVMMLEAVVNREVSAINYNMKKAIDELGERNTPRANNRQQLAMTSINNLALVLDEAVQSMQSQMQSKPGNCDKPGGGKPKPGQGKPGNLKSLQQQLNQQLESLKKQMEGGKQPGSKGKNGMPSGMSKELAQMAAKQAAIRRSLEQLQERIGEGEDGKNGSLQRLADLMEETETDLVNKSITNETLLRQQEILSRLLQSEKAEREREKEERRESREFSDKINRNPNSFLEYNRRKEREIELLQTLPPSFSPFYKGKVTEYFNKIEQ